MIGCVNKSLPEYKTIADYYGDDLAEKFVIGYTTNVVKSTTEYYYPTLKEIKHWLTSDKQYRAGYIRRALQVNPNLSKEAILSFLKGIVHMYNGTLYVISGRSNESKLVTRNFINDIYLPNKKVLSILEREFPDIFKVIPTSKLYTTVLEITPRTQKEIAFQKEGMESTAASPRTIEMLKDFLKRIGVNLNNVDQIVVDGVKQDAKGMAVLMQKLIQVIDGKEAEALPEEAMHFAVAIIKQTNPKLYNKLLNEINNYNILNETFALYGNDPFYQKDGKPDVIKIKEEAIGKVLAETIIYHADNLNEKPETLSKVSSWWKQILDFIKSLFVKSGFDQAAMDIISGKEIGTSEDINEQSDVYLQKDLQSSLFDMLDQVSASITKLDDGYEINGKRVRRVSDTVKDWYERRFKDRDLTKTEYEIAVDDLKAEKGTAGHAAFEYAFHLMVDENGYLRETELPDDDYEIKNPNFKREFYEKLKTNLRERLASFPSGTRFKSEITVYSAKRKIAGTIDFLAIEPSGKIHILDWKFMDLNIMKYEDIPWYKVAAWNTQMNAYLNILMDGYGVKNENVGQTRMIPIRAEYSQAFPSKKILPQLIGVHIGAVNPKNIEDDYLLPVPLKFEKVENRRVNELLIKLNAEYERLSMKSVKTEDKALKAEQLNSLFTAIRHLHLKGDLRPLLEQAKILNSQIQKFIDTYKSTYEGKDYALFNDNQRNDFLRENEEYLQIMNIYSDLYTDLRSLFEGELTEDDKQLKNDLRDTSDDAKAYQSELRHILETFTAEHVAKSENILDFLSPEKIIKGLPKWFGTTATIQLNSLHVMFKKANKALGYSLQDSMNEAQKLRDIEQEYNKWAKSKGLSIKNYFDIIKKKNKNELINEYDVEFYKLLKSKTKANTRDVKWIMENVDKEAYKTFLSEQLDREINRILNKPGVFTEEEIEQIEIAKKKGISAATNLPYSVRSSIQRIKTLYDISTPESPGWLINDFVRKFPKDKWISKEWKELNKPENKPAKDFYDYIRQKNEEYADLGYISRADARVFLPFVHKGLIEKILSGGDIKFGESFLRAISIDEGDTGFGKQDPLTGKPIDTIPKYFTTEFEGTVSEDLFRTMAMYNEAALRYKYMKEIEYQVRALVAVERNKKAISTSIYGKTEKKDGEIVYTNNNDENAKLVEDMMKGIIYNQMYITSEVFDQLLGKIGNWGAYLNKKLHINVFPEDLSNRQLSINKVITEMNTIFQLNTLGLNLLSSTSNFFGGNAQSLINAGIYYTKADYISAEMMMVVNKFGGTDQKKMLAAFEYFLPLTENYHREMIKKLSILGLTTEGLQDGLMYFMRKGDWVVQSSNFFAYLNNTVMIDNKLVNAREYLRSQDKYKNKYDVSKEERVKLEQEFEKEVEDLINEKAVMKLATIENNKLVIPGLDQKDDSVMELRRIVQQINRDALGNMSDDNLRKINMNVYGKSFMVFKNWIPRLMEVRLVDLQYNAASDRYEWGRIRNIFRIISEDLTHSLANLRNSLLGNEEGMKFVRELYEKKKEEYESETGKTLYMTEDQFIDLVRANIKNQIIDVIFLTSMFILIAGLKAFAPDDDEDPAVKSQYRFIVRAADKFKDELSYFYDPTSVQGLVSNIFPAMSLIENFLKGIKNFMIENWAIATGDKKLEKDTKVIKYWMKTFPFTNQVVGYLPMFYPELAKDLGVKIQSNYGIR